MSMTRPVDVSIQAVSPESVLGGSVLGASAGAVGPAASAGVSARTTDPTSSNQTPTSSTIEERFTD